MSFDESDEPGLGDTDRDIEAEFLCELVEVPSPPQVDCWDDIEWLLDFRGLLDWYVGPDRGEVIVIVDDAIARVRGGVVDKNPASGGIAPPPGGS